ncbi:M24 family metallopeptidase [Pedococcus sp. P5_B7]
MTVLDETAQHRSPLPILHVPRSEYAERQKRVTEELQRRGLDGLLVSRIEDQHWLCGLDTTGYTIFHCMYIGADGALTHLTRSADLANIAYSSVCEDVRLWEDRHGNSRSAGIKDLLISHGLQGRRVGVQLDTFGMLPDLYLELQSTLAGWCNLVEASDVIRRLRLVKSPAELDFMRKAGEILQEATEAAVALVEPGADEGEIVGEFYRTVLRCGGDTPASVLPVGAGQRALLFRYVTGFGTVSANDQMTFELGASFRHYNVANMFTVLTGPEINEEHLRMHAACSDALDRIQTLLVPGRRVGEVFDEHRRAFADHGFDHATLKACGYPMGAMWPPTWMERPMISEGEPLVFEPGMVFFTHMILGDRPAGLTMSLGETVIIRADGGPEILAPVGREPFIVR